MTTRIPKQEVVRRLAQRMNAEEKTAAAWLDACTETVYDALKQGESVTLPHFGGFYVCPRDHGTWTCFNERITSPLRVGEVVEVTNMAPADECEHDMFVEIQWQDRSLAVPLYQLEGIAVDDGTEEAIGDWHYWINSGYGF